MRVQRVVLEDHRDVAVLRLQVVDHRVVDRDVAARLNAVRAAGGALFLIGSLVMAYNLWMTVRAGEAEVQSPVALQPAE